MYLYQATRDPFLLEVAVEILESIEHSTRTLCGYATVSTHCIIHSAIEISIPRLIWHFRLYSLCH